MRFLGTIRLILLFLNLPLVFYFNNGKGNKAFSDVVTIEDNTLDDSIRIKDQFLETSVSYNLEVPEEFVTTNEEVRRKLTVLEQQCLKN